MARILIVDDEVIVLNSMGILLKSEGHEVTALSKGDEACNLLQKRSFDLLITDIRMSPVDGMELIRFAHKQCPGMPVIVVSAYASDSTASESMAAGSVAYIKKPFKISEVLEAVTKALKK